MTMLDTELIRAHAACDGLRVETVGETGSTNRILMDAPFGDAPAPPTLLAARRQTAGRGRRGRAWLSPADRSAAFSIAFERAVRLEPPPAALSLAVGAAAASALSRWATDLRLKWPNDLLRPGGKCGGILVECRRSIAAAGCEQIERIVVGIGLNLLAPPEEAAVGQRACGLFDGATLPVRMTETVIGALAAAVVPAVGRFLTEGLGPFVETWRSFDAFDGEPVVVLDGDRVLASGRALGIDDRGGLRVQTAAGLQVLGSGEVSLRRLAEAH